MVRIYDLATKFRLTTKEVLERLQAVGIEATTFSSSVEEQAAREILSQPLAKIPARTIRPGTGTTVRPTTRRAARSKAAAPQTSTAAADKARTRAKSAPAEEVKGEAKPRTHRPQPAATSQAKPLVVTLEAPRVEPAIHAPSARNAMTIRPVTSPPAGGAPQARPPIAGARQ